MSVVATPPRVHPAAPTRLHSGGGEISGGFINASPPHRCRRRSAAHCRPRRWASPPSSGPPSGSPRPPRRERGASLAERSRHSRSGRGVGRPRRPDSATATDSWRRGQRAGMCPAAAARRRHARSSPRARPEGRVRAGGGYDSNRRDTRRTPARRLRARANWPPRSARAAPRPSFPVDPALPFAAAPANRADSSLTVAPRRYHGVGVCSGHAREVGRRSVGHLGSCPGNRGFGRPDLFLNGSSVHVSRQKSRPTTPRW